MLYTGGWQAVVFDLGSSRLVSSAVALHYGTAGVSAGISAPYGVTTQNQQSISVPYGIAARYRTSSQLITPWAQRLQAVLFAVWFDATHVSSIVVCPWGFMSPSLVALRSPWVDRSSVAVPLLAQWASSSRDLVMAGLSTPWADSTPTWRSLDAEPRLLLGGNTLQVLSASLSADEGSPYWMANITMAHRADYDRLHYGAAFTLILAGESYALVVDGRTLGRPVLDDEVPAITARSPLCLLDAPFCEPISLTSTQPVEASAQVEAMLGPVDWQLLDWTIPAGRIAFNNATPLAVATAIVAAVGGLIESRPDGSIVCRPRHAVRPCADQYDLDIGEADVFSLSENIASNATFDAVVVGDGQDKSGDEIEFLADEATPYRGVVRAFPSPWREVSLVHSSQNVSISPRGVIEFTTEEVVEVIGGAAQCRYPVGRIISTEWRYANLGAIRGAGKTITSAEPGYSLLAITYASSAYAWDVSHQEIEDVQFLLMEQ